MAAGSACSSCWIRNRSDLAGDRERTEGPGGLNSTMCGLRTGTSRRQKSLPTPRVGLNGGGARPTQTGEPDWVLRDVSFVLEPGETIAVVGIRERAKLR